MTKFVAVRPPKRQLDWPGKRVRLVRDVSTGAQVIPANRPGTVSHVSRGLISINFDRCECCGVAARFRWSRIDDPALVEFIEPQDLV